MDYMDSNKIGQRIENKLIHALGRTISEATNDEIYKAAAECIRDDIMISWADSRKGYKSKESRNFTICQPNF